MEHTLSDNPFSFAEVVSGAAAGFAEHFFMFPFDTIKTRLQSGTSSKIRGALWSILMEERWTHFYRGCIPVLFSAVPAHAAYFGVYEAAKRTVGDSSSGIAVAACCATIAHDTISTPFDVVKQRMQMDKKRIFTSSANCAKRVVKDNGLFVLFRSLPTTLTMNIPHILTYWLVYENTLSQVAGGERHHDTEFSKDFIMAGALAGGCAAIVSFPLDTIKTHQQLSLGTSAASTFRSITAQSGFRGLFKGVSARVIHTSSSGAIMMVTYENMKKLLDR